MASRARLPGTPASIAVLILSFFQATNPNIRLGGQATSNWKIRCGLHP
ncbi:THAUMATIN-LIKE PROTEIN 1 [Zea mays]|uniref:THAUMATIN-LIKE PROTEIN 1 n=1 Tax=Zea mays TaxID=4577 RepID=A0A1D6QMT5_MAIZE|nr:THAUMATIN-LIKE PROTEIN 1 [Zea mays]